MTLNTTPLFEQWMHDPVHQSPLLGAMGFMTTDAISLHHRNPLVGIVHGGSLKVVTGAAKVGTCVRNKSFCLSIVWHMAFQALTVLNRDMHQSVIFQSVGQTRMAREA